MTSVQLLNTISKAKWEKIGLKKRAGVLAPLFTLSSQNSPGIGDFSCLKQLIDWAVLTGNSIVQLLPMNEMGSHYCPYDAISSFALEPVFLSFKQSGFASGPYVNYAIKKEKLRLAKEAFLRENISASEQFSQFSEKNKYWLEDFALFIALKQLHQGKAWYGWDEKYRLRENKALRDFQEANQQEIIFQKWLQWFIFRQFKEAKDYAAKNNILLIGDLPILVSRDSADVWAHPEFFKLDFAAGAPPDMYCAKGQRWGMPTYRWEAIASDGYRYLKEKLAYAQNFYDILRIDHVVGLFRIWSIAYGEPIENQGINGFFDPQDESKWASHGREILSTILEGAGVLLCAEDLGMIPPACTRALEDFGIPGNDVQRWNKDWLAMHDFLLPAEYRLNSVAMLSTHDTTNWQAWWENEAGTVDEALFMRKCAGRVNYASVKDKLFDPLLSRRGRLRWLNSIDSVDKLVEGLSPKGTVPQGHLLDFIDLYENSYQEKEKLWKQMGLSGQMREKSDKEILAAALKIALEANSIFSIQLITDWLALAPDIMPGEAYDYRVNTPGTISPKNWSQVMPISLEKLMRHPLCGQIRQLIKSSGRS
ncbi:MAG: 4-alpha-glucanotransferase [Candidatus Omnitrophota bacterium]